MDSIWYEVLLFANKSEFGTTEVLYNQDLSFYFFTLPILKVGYDVLIVFGLGFVLLTFLYTVFLMYRESSFGISDGIDFSDGKNLLTEWLKAFWQMTSRQVGLFFAIFFAILAMGQGIRLFEMVYGGTGMVYGAGASDIVIGQKVIWINLALALVGMVTSIVAGVQKKGKLLLTMPGILIVVGIIGGLTQGAYEYLAVVPNQFTAEKPYIEANIAATRAAYGLDDVIVKDYSPTEEITAQDLEDNATTISNIPINDPGPTQEMYNSLQGIRNYYHFYDVDVDRYDVDGTYTQVFLGAREMDNDSLAEEAKTWVNQHLKYTHGFGVALSPVNKTNSVGQPDLYVKDIPPISLTKNLTIAEPRIYYGEGDDNYVIVGGDNLEFDYPEGNNNQEITYNGTGGISLGGINRLAFTLYTGSPEMLLSSEISGESKILINRNVMERIKKIAPFLQYDGDPYMVLAEGKQYWIADAFVTSDAYPYAQPFDDRGNNYIKNPVKVVVNAYDGDVNFYQVEDEPIVNTYAKIFPEMFKPISEMPEGLEAHLRYSQTLFDIQAQTYSTYHMDNPQVFYNKEDQWDPAHQFFGDSKEEMEMESAYTIMKLPDRETEFMLTKSFTPKGKDNMIAWLAGVSDGAEYGQLLLYQFPKQASIYGPMQMEQRIDQDTTISPQLTLLGQEGSKVLRGNMMTIPIGEGLIYVKPIYIQATSGENNLPEVKKVIVCYENEIIMEDTLGQALEGIFGEGAGQTSQVEPSEETPTTSEPTESSGGTAAEMVTKANALYDEAIAAQKAGDWATYGAKLTELEQVLAELSTKVK